MGSQTTPTGTIQPTTDATNSTATIDVSIAEARPISSRIALNLGNLSKGKHPV
jgi:hypothetical protein